MSASRLTAWVTTMNTTARWVIGALVAAFTLGGYVTMATTADAAQDKRLDVLEDASRRAEDTAFNAWAACLANREKLLALGIQCREVRR